MQGSLYRPSLGSDQLGRYYTAEWVSDHLIGQINIKNPKLIMELGAGSGSLSGAAHTRWKTAELVTVDLDTKIFETIRKGDPKVAHTHHVHDVLDYELDKRIELNFSSVDVGVCNPPYIRPRWRSGFAQILEDAGLTGSLKSIYDAGADLLFIAQNLRFLRPGGKLGVILPDGLITGEKFAGVRKNLITNQTISSVIQLPKRAFTKTEAQTYLVILEKLPSANGEIQLFNLDAPGTLSFPILIDQNEGVSRLDYKHHQVSRKHITPKHPIKMKDVCESLIRGNVSSSEIFGTTYPVFHLNDFSSEFFGSEIDLPLKLRLKKSHSAHLPPHSKIALPGDILMARVGRNLEQKIFMLRSGSCVISDCIFALRVHEKKRQKVFRFLCSERGKATISSLARGVGANHISKNDILNLCF